MVCMVELGELEKHHQEFDKRSVRIVVVSNDDPATAAITQADFPHLTVVSDAEQNIARALGVIHSGMGPGGADTNAPTTFLVSGDGTVRWLFRPERFITRLSPDQLVAAIDKNPL
jgi:peroxiredoxin